jgi:hypothetical protein
LAIQPDAPLSMGSVISSVVPCPTGLATSILLPVPVRRELNPDAAYRTIPLVGIYTGSVVNY